MIANGLAGYRAMQSTLAVYNLCSYHDPGSQLEDVSTIAAASASSIFFTLTM